MSDLTPCQQHDLLAAAIRVVRVFDDCPAQGIRGPAAIRNLRRIVANIAPDQGKLRLQPACNPRNLANS